VIRHHLIKTKNDHIKFARDKKQSALNFLGIKNKHELKSQLNFGSQLRTKITHARYKAALPKESITLQKDKTSLPKISTLLLSTH
jgi:hypothetical protein